MPTNEPDKERHDLEDLGTPGKLPKELLLPEVAEPRKKIYAKAEKVVWSNPDNTGEAIYEAPEFQANIEALNILNGGIIRALEENDLAAASKLKKERLLLETSVSKNSRAAQANALKNYKLINDAANVEDRNKLSKSRREALKGYASVAKRWIIKASEGIGKGTVALTEGALFLGKSATDLTAHVLRAGFSVGADAAKEIGIAAHIIAEDKRDRGLNPPN